MNTTHTDVLIIGAGPAGTISASILKKAGLDVTIIEKTQFPRFVIGESLLPRCMDLLDEADLLKAVESKNFQKKYDAKFIQKNKSCDFNFSEQFTKGWTWTWQVQRADFDKTLADEVISRGVKLKYNTTVTDVNITDTGVFTTVETEGETLNVGSKYIIDASGYGRVLPRILGLDAPSTLPPRSAFFSHVIDANRPLSEDGNRIQIVVIEPEIWAWIIPFSDNTTSVGIVGDLSKYLIGGNKTKALNEILNTNPHLKTRFASSSFKFEPQLITGYSASVTKFHGNRFVLTGNSTEFLDPIFSSGVTFALESGLLSAKLIVKELNGETVNWDKEYVDYIQQGVNTFRSYIDAWYDETLPNIFFADNINPDIKDRICSVLAGYVWDKTNPYVKKHATALKTLAQVIKIQNE